ncbi:MAG: competence/damage-inducible protein A [Bryobacter sp.]|nr:competence/damage-inducible protein A [Bryobacter sp.]
MQAAIIAVGSEMLTPSRVDTNSLYLTEKLNDLGVEVVQKLVIGDHRPRLSAAIRFCLEQAEILIVIGGLGPTEDDLTREAVADATGRALVFDKQLVAAMEARFAALGRKMAEINKRQAYVLEGAEVLPNARGTAPGQWVVLANRQVVVLVPGPPAEMKPLADGEVFPRLAKMLPPLALATLTYRIAGMGESDVDARLAPIYKQYENPVTTILAKAGDITIHLRAQCAEKAEAERLIEEVGAKIRAEMGNFIYSFDGAPIEEVILRRLVAREQTLTVAESLTAGMVGARFGSVPGASRAFVGGMVTYNNGQKQALLGVDPWTLAEHSEVSEAVAIQMAEGAKARTSAHWALSLTGYAGPDGGTEANPVGTVFVGLAGPDRPARAKRFRFPAGDRERVRLFALHAALNFLRLELEA